MAEKESKNKITADEKYHLPEFPNKIKCPICNDGMINMKRTIHSLPDGEDILILLMQCDKCNYKNTDVITLNTAFKPGRYILHVKNGDLSHKIFRSPYGSFELPEADFEIEPGNIAGYMVTNIEGILERMINWTEFMIRNLENQNEKNPKKRKIESVLNILKDCFNGKRDFHIVLEDKEGGSYISPAEGSSDVLKFEPF